MSEQYDEAERHYFDRVRAGSDAAELAAAARRVSERASDWQSAAYAEFFSQRDLHGESARMVIEKEIEAEKAELLHELWADIAAAHTATAA